MCGSNKVTMKFLINLHKKYLHKKVYKNTTARLTYCGIPNIWA